jgi:crotonobetainyl-CoA dehydrogenase
MDFAITDEQQLLLDSVDEICERYGSEQYFKECDEEHRWPKEFTDALLENGFQSLGLPEEFGGTPVDVQTLMLVAERMCKNGVPIYVYGNICSLKDMTEFGSDEQKKQCFDEVAKGNPGFVLGFTEPGAGSDSSALASTYKRQNGKVYLNGNKSFMTNSQNSKYMLCVARNADDDPTLKENRSKFSMWWVPIHNDDGSVAQGITIEPLEKIGWNMGNTCELHMDNVELEEKDLVGVEGNGFMQAMVNFEVERLLACAQSLGAAECAFEDATHYATQRIQFGRPIGKNQLIQEHITNMYMAIENMRNWVYKTAWEIDNGIPVQIDSAVAKLYCGRSAFKVVDTAMQVMGGIGYTKDCRISRLWRDQRVYRIGAGTDEIMIHIAGRAIQKLYQD